MTFLNFRWKKRTNRRRRREERRRRKGLVEANAEGMLYVNVETTIQFLFYNISVTEL